MPGGQPAKAVFERAAATLWLPVGSASRKPPCLQSQMTNTCCKTHLLKLQFEPNTSVRPSDPDGLSSRHDK